MTTKAASITPNYIFASGAFRIEGESNNWP